MSRISMVGMVAVFLIGIGCSSTSPIIPVFVHPVREASLFSYPKASSSRSTARLILVSMSEFCMCGFRTGIAGCVIHANVLTSGIRWLRSRSVFTEIADAHPTATIVRSVVRKRLNRRILLLLQEWCSRIASLIPLESEEPVTIRRT